MSDCAWLIRLYLGLLPPELRHPIETILPPPAPDTHAPLPAQEPRADQPVAEGVKEASSVASPRSPTREEVQRSRYADEDEGVAPDPVNPLARPLARIIRMMELETGEIKGVSHM